MALSNMRIVSDGTLEVVDISFDYFERTEISVFFDSVPQSTGWEWGSEQNLLFTPAVPEGVEVLIQRKTDASVLRHEFSKGSSFTAGTLDEDLRQVLHIVQEASESNFSKDFFDDINMNGFTIKNLRPAAADNEAISLGDVKQQSTTAWQAAAQATTAKGIAEAWAVSPTEVVPGNDSAKTYAGRAATSAATATSAASAANTSAGIASSAEFEAEAHKDAAASSASSAYISADRATSKASEAAASAAAAATFDPQFYVAQTGPAGVAKLPKSNTGTGTAGDFRYNDVKNRVEYWNPTTSTWAAVGAGGELFDYAWHNGPRSSIDAGRVPTDGQQLLLLTHPDVCQAIWAGKQHSVTDAVWQVDPTKRNCWSRGDGTSWVRVPDLNAAVAGTGKPFYLRGGTDALNGTSVGDAIREIAATFGTISQAVPTGAAVAESTVGGTWASGASYYRQIAFKASAVVPTADENRVKTAYGVWTVRVFTEVSNVGALDAGQLATQLGTVDAQVQALDANTGFTIIYPNGGTAATPANVNVNSRYVMANPFPGHHIICIAEVLYSGVWADTGWDGNSGTGGLSYGVRAIHTTPGDSVVVQTGTGNVLISSAQTGGGHGAPAGAAASTLPCRVKVWKLKGGI